jgi:hypothetical protein
MSERNDVDEGNVWPDEELDEEAPPAPAEPMHKARRRWQEMSRRYGMDPWLFR